MEELHEMKAFTDLKMTKVKFINITQEKTPSQQSTTDRTLLIELFINHVPCNFDIHRNPDMLLALCANINITISVVLSWEYSKLGGHF